MSFIILFVLFFLEFPKSLNEITKQALNIIGSPLSITTVKSYISKRISILITILNPLFYF
jgi:hypothetical protein